LILFLIVGHPAAEGWDGRPHPDTVDNGKYILCIEGIEKILKTLAPWMTNCYVWFDYGCIDQDGDPAGELRQLDKIIQICDYIFTPIHDKDPSCWDFAKSIHNYYDDYKSSSWSGNPFSYLNRGWCRIEMFYAVNIPLLNAVELNNKEDERKMKFSKGFSFHRNAGYRPHILYGSKEHVTPGSSVKMLPPLQNSYFEKYHPAKGHLTKESDKLTIERLIEELKPFMKTVKEGYTGQEQGGKYHGKGTYMYANGDKYVGERKDGKMTGKGTFTFTNGHSYKGDWVLNKRTGHGEFMYSNVHYYVGEWKDNKRHGKGKYYFANDDSYEGDWKFDQMTGSGIYLCKW
jgi:hypothetical protein